MKKIAFLGLLFIVFATFIGCASVSKSQKEELLEDDYFVAIHKTKVDKTQTGFSWFSYGVVFLYIPHYDNDLRSLSIKFQNLSQDIISEINFSVMPHDKDGNIVGNTTNGETKAIVTYKNLIKPNKTKTATWTGVWLNKNIVYTSIEGIEVKYSNGNVVHYNKEQTQGMLIGSANNPRIKSNSDKGFYMNFGVLYNYSKLTPDPVIESNGVGLSFGIGGDFGRITLGVDGDMDLLTAVTYTGYGYSPPQSIDSYINAGFRLRPCRKII